MIKNAEILKGIEFNNIDDELLKKALIDKFSKNINKEIIPGVSYIPVSGKVIDEDDVLWGIESMMDAWLTAGRFSLKLEKELAEATDKKKIAELTESLAARKSWLAVVSATAK